MTLSKSFLGRTRTLPFTNSPAIGLLLLLLSAFLLLVSSPAPVFPADSGQLPTKLATPEIQEKLETQAQVRVIVLLEGYQSFSGLTSPGGTVARLNVQASVARLQDGFLGLLDQTMAQEARRLENLPIISLAVDRKGLEALEGMDEVALIQEDRRLTIHTAQGIPLMQPGTFRDGYGGAGVAVAVIDTGIDYTHPALSLASDPPPGDVDNGNGDGGGIISQLSGFPNTKVLGGFDFGENDSDPMDTLGHGTASAALAAGLNTGVGDYIGGAAPQAGLYALKVSGADGSIFESDFLSALDWCLSHQLDHPDQPLMIVSVSLGTPDFQANAFCDDISPASAAQVNLLAANGIAVFVSSGNDGYCAGVSEPACLSQTIAVGAVYDAPLGTQPGPGLGFCINVASCIGFPTSGCPYGALCQDATSAPDQVPCYSNSGLTLDVLAPSNCAYTPALNGGYETCFGGTSAACPYAAGAGAVVQSAAKALLGRFLTVAELKQILKDSGDPVFDSKSGLTTPRINITNAVTALGALPSDNPLAGKGTPRKVAKNP